ncbi:MAG TPA: DUF4350 domain-containing protein [Acidimicrobiales bacterium]
MTATDRSSPAAGWAARWAGLGPVQKFVVGLVAVVVAVNLGFAALGSVFGGTPSGPPSSSYTTASDGFAAWADLLATDGRPVARLRTVLADASLPSGSTLVVADPATLSDADVTRVASFVARGGRLVAVGEGATGLIGAVAGSPISWSPAGERRAAPLVPVEAVAGVGKVDSVGEGSYEEVGGLLPILGVSGRVTGVAGSVGRGPVVGIADGTPFDNDRLAHADNARLSVAVVGAHRPVVFAEAEHGFGPGGGIDAVPSAWRWAALFGLVAFVVAVWSAGRRFGPAEAGVRTLRPPRVDHVDALAASMTKVGGPPAPTVAPLAAGARQLLLARVGLPPDAPADALRAAAHAAGMPAELVEPLLTPPSTAADLVQVGRAAAQLRGGRSPGSLPPADPPGASL